MSLRNLKYLKINIQKLQEWEETNNGKDLDYLHIDIYDDIITRRNLDIKYKH